MEIPIITTDSYGDEFEEQDKGAVTARRKRPRSKYEFKGSQSHRCSLVAVCEADTGKTTVKWSSVRVGKEARKMSACPKTNSANGGLSLTSPSLNDNAGGKEVRVYKTKPASIQDLRNRIVSETEHMSQQEITNSSQVSNTGLLFVKW